VKVQTLTIAAAAAALVLSTAGTAVASPLSKPKPKPKTHTVTQVTGSTLKKALLPASEYGIGYTSGGEADSGGHLVSGDPYGSAGNLPCDYLGAVALTGFGETATAGSTIDSPDSVTAGLLTGAQGVQQFANSSQAWSFVTAEQAKYGKCTFYSGAFQGSQGSSGGTIAYVLQSAKWGKVDGYSSFAADQSAQFTDDAGDNEVVYIETTVVQAGTNVYTVQELNTVDSGVPSWALDNLIKATQKLYTISTAKKVTKS
jgi:hypothetical protein